VGALKKEYAKKGVQDYLERISRYLPVEMTEVRDARFAGTGKREAAMKQEAEALLKNLKSTDYVAAMTDKGRAYSSTEFSAFIEKVMAMGSKKRLVFVIGGSYGLHESLTERADSLVSLSKMTLPHDMARLVLFEQVYRAFTIMRNEPYSH